ncbi:MAG: cell division protein FtsZ [Flectobacillus sp.]|nr:cell division protein FtsZ [Flectobacillus sp.]
MAFFEHNIELKQESTTNIIKVIGVGGGGSNAVRHMYDMKIKDVDFIVCNTDLQALNDNSVPIKLQLGAILTEGLGAGTEPEQGRLAALESEAQIRSLFQDNTKMLFITAGMGGGTGTGAAPEIARIARELDILTVAIVTAPYSWEGTEKIDAAMRGIEELQRTCDTVLVVLNDKLLEIFEDLNILEAFEHADDVLANAAKSVAEVITKSGKINADFKDVKKVLSNAGQAVMSTASAEGPNRASEVIRKALDSPLLNNKDIKGAKRILVTIATSREKAMAVKEQTAITSYIMEQVGSSPEGFKLGYIIDDELKDDMRLTMIAAGFNLPEDSPIKGVSRPMVKRNEVKEVRRVAAPTPPVSDERFERRIQREREVVEEEEEVEKVVPAMVAESKPTMPVMPKKEDDSLRLKKMIDSFSQRMPSEADLETPAYQRYKVELFDISQLPEVELFEVPLYG